ncbi:YqjF family protein [Phycicoccus flavus]|uniref:YqjF family protein n=1 Tax=Phycicoccus flavus TaxID=2502783 RepID=UPI001F190B36|nr:DUF2071 domain-containing protein [Phycicoccus flavus]
MRQTWADITFVHWAVDPALVAPHLPPGTRPDVLDGATYVGLIPFRMEHAGFGVGPRVPWLGDFLETNVRLYAVDDAGRHGVVFASLECQRLLVALGARAVTGTRYTWARMRTSRERDRVRYETRRRWPGPRGAASRMDVTVGAPVAEPSPVEQFVTARFGLHSVVAGRTLWIPNTHEPWPLRRATLDRLDDDLVAAAGFGDLAGTPPDSVLHSAGTYTEFGLPARLRT